uniref:Dehydrogenase/reductase SDR family member 1 n=1 Tax=Chelonoidis abingdonii TaxID=106734 RepID=A0A8C0INT6_CHEAB
PCSKQDQSPAKSIEPAGHGLIVIISSPGGLRYMFNVPYGVGKAACDRLAADCAIELRPYSVACVALWPGLVRTEAVLREAEGSGPEIIHVNKIDNIAWLASFLCALVFWWADNCCIFNSFDQLSQTAEVGTLQHL